MVFNDSIWRKMARKMMDLRVKESCSRGLGKKELEVLREIKKEMVTAHLSHDNGEPLSEISVN